jgi:hypothetical protein
MGVNPGEARDRTLVAWLPAASLCHTSHYSVLLLKIKTMINLQPRITGIMKIHQGWAFSNINRSKIMSLYALPTNSKMTLSSMQRAESSLKISQRCSPCHLFFLLLSFLLHSEINILVINIVRRNHLTSAAAR